MDGMICRYTKTTHKIIKLRWARARAHTHLCFVYARTVCVCSSMHEVWSLLQYVNWTHISARLKPMKIIHGNLHTLNFQESFYFCLLSVILQEENQRTKPNRLTEWMSERARVHSGVCKVKQDKNCKRKWDKDGINYICVFEARPHILTRTHGIWNMQNGPHCNRTNATFPRFNISWRSKLSPSLFTAASAVVVALFFQRCFLIFLLFKNVVSAPLVISIHFPHIHNTVCKSTQMLIHAKRLKNVFSFFLSLRTPISSHRVHISTCTKAKWKRERKDENQNVQIEWINGKSANIKNLWCFATGFKMRDSDFETSNIEIGTQYMTMLGKYGMDEDGAKNYNEKRKKK